MRRLVNWICSRSSERSRGTHYKEFPLTSTSVCEIVCTRYPFVLRQALESHKLLFQCRSQPTQGCSISDTPQLNESFSIAGVEPNGYRLLCQDLGSTAIPKRWEDRIKIFSKSSWCEILLESRYGLTQRCQHGQNRNPSRNRAKNRFIYLSHRTPRGYQWMGRCHANNRSHKTCICLYQKQKPCVLSSSLNWLFRWVSALFASGLTAALAKINVFWCLLYDRSKWLRNHTRYC